MWPRHGAKSEVKPTKNTITAASVIRKLRYSEAP
jgi:hypothetical protein